ncbi:MAG: 4Fe-4S binding protein [Myxococcota bacterium]|jgi:MinD superfamily P-loop ATPase|nr:4Fe-4S binding protein [Myxococcota bacterium]
MTDNNQAPLRYPVIEMSRCSMCRACIDACPNRAIEEPTSFSCAKCVQYCRSMIAPCKPAKLIVCRERCDGCGRCVIACPELAIDWEAVGDVGPPA